MKFTPFLAVGLYLCLHLAVFAPACTNDELPAPTSPEFCDTLIASYITNVQPIIEESCAYSGCHDGAGGIGPGNYTTYNGMLTFLETGSFRSRVISQREDVVSGMPPNQTVYPESKKDDLTEAELRVIECWLDAGYPEN